MAERSRGRDAVVLVVSAALLILLSAAGKGIFPPMGEDEHSGSAALPSPLPSGAATRPPSAPLDPTGGCSFEDRGFGEYERWQPLRLGRALLPRAGGGVSDAGEFDLLVHFHGADAIRKQLAPEDLGLVVVGIDAGTLSSHYQQVVPPPATLDTLVSGVESAVAAAAGIRTARAAHIAVSSWSAGYGAVSQLLAAPHDRLEAVILLDSLHASFLPGKRDLEPGQLAPFVAMARAAADAGPLFYLTHSAIATPDYASTSDVAAFLLRSVGAERGRFFVRGYPGDDKMAHCAHLRLLVPVLRQHVLSEWRRPRDAPGHAPASDP